MRAIYKKLQMAWHIPFVMAFLSFLFYWLALPRSGQVYLIFLVPMIWTFLVFQAQKKDRSCSDDPFSDTCNNHSCSNHSRKENNQTNEDNQTNINNKASKNSKTSEYSKTSENKETSENDPTSKDKESRAVQRTSRGFFSLVRHFTERIFRTLTSFYGQIWMAAAIFWLVLNHWLIFPHPFLILGWLALSLYLAAYVPLYVWLVRRLTVCLNMPILLASPLCWIAVEWLRKHGFGGYSFGSLEHVFYRMPRWIQLSGGLFGEYAVGAWIILIGTAMALIWEQFRKGKYEWGIMTIFFLNLLFIGNGIYGDLAMKRIRQSTEKQNNPPVRVALLQDPTCFTFPVSDELNWQMYQEYLRLTREALTLSPKPDLIVWPESSSIDTEILAEKGAFLPGMDRLDPGERQKRMDKFLSEKKERRAQWLETIKTPVLYGVGSLELKKNGPPETYNSAIYWDGRGNLLRYDKISLIMFGEYFPLIEYLPKSLPIRSLCNSVQPGKKSIIFPLYRRNISLTTTEKESQQPEHPVETAINICFESTLPHFIASQLDELEKQGKYPTVLINISNIGWFQHSVQNEFHLATHVFRATENRKTVLTATHGGFSAGVAPDGTIFALGTNGKAEAVIADFQPVSLTRSGFWGHHLPVYDLILVCGLITGSFCHRSKKLKKRN